MRPAHAAPVKNSNIATGRSRFLFDRILFSFYKIEENGKEVKMQNQEKKQDAGIPRIHSIFGHTAQPSFINPTLVHIQSYISAIETQNLLEMSVNCASRFPESKQNTIFLNLQSLAYHLDINEQTENLLKKVRALLDNKNSSSSDLDLAVTDFLTQIKPVFLATFAEKTTALFTKSSDHIEIPVFIHKFASNIIDGLKKYRDTIGINSISPLTEILTEKRSPHDLPNRYAEYALNETTKMFDMMRPVLSEKEQGKMIQHILDIFQKTSCFETAKMYESQKAAARKIAEMMKNI